MYKLTLFLMTFFVVNSKSSALPINNHGVNTPPTVVSISPVNNAQNVSQNANIIITFDEQVSLAQDSTMPLIDNSIIVDCTISGVQSYPQVDTDGVIIANIDFNDFINGDECTITISAFWIHDIDDGNHFDGNGDGISSPVDDDFITTFHVGNTVDPIFINGFE